MGAEFESLSGKILSLAMVLFAGSVSAATYYIDDSGSNTNDGRSPAAPFGRWDNAFSRTTCGDRLVVMDGTYSESTNGRFQLNKTCSASSPYTVVAQSERRAFISSNGSATPMAITGSAHVFVEGIRVKNVDVTPGAFSSNVLVSDSNNVTLRRLLVSHNNRYYNSHLVQFSRSTACLLEESELYDFHRHGVIVNRSERITLRRNYCNARNRPGIPGGYNGTSGDNGTGDDCIVIYPGDDNIIENNISDGLMGAAFDVEANGAGRGNKFLGNIALGPRKGVSLDVRGNTAAHMPRDTVVENLVVVGAIDEGFSTTSNKNTRCSHCTIIDSKVGFDVKVLPAAGGDGVYSMFIDNTLVAGGAGAGFNISTAVQTWSVTQSNFFGHSPNRLPASDSRYVGVISLSPQMGSCRVWVPSSSPMKGAGRAGSDIGATILYRYQDSVQTRVPLWHPTTGDFPRGAIISGVNDVAGKSLFDIDERLNVNRNGCPFPAGYSSGNPLTPMQPSAFLVK